MGKVDIEAQEPSLKENRVQNYRQGQCLVTGEVVSMILEERLEGVHGVDHELG